MVPIDKGANLEAAGGGTRGQVIGICKQAVTAAFLFALRYRVERLGCLIPAKEDY